MGHHINFGSRHTDPVDARPYVITGNSAVAHSLRQMTRLAAESDSPILVTGPRGSGKEWVARSIHANSARCFGPFVKVDCAAQNDILAGSNHPETRQLIFPQCGSSIESADKGVLYLKDVDAASCDVQFLLWQLFAEIQTKSQHPFAQTGLDIKIIAGSSDCMLTSVRAGAFRQDLYQQLSLLTLPITPLRQRRDDIGPLIDDMQSEHDPAIRFTIEFDALAELQAHNWFGNMRELSALVSRACALYPGKNLGQFHIRSLLNMGNGIGLNAIGLRKSMTESIEACAPTGQEFSLREYLADEEISFLCAALHQARGNVQWAADITGMKRTTFAEKMRRHKIERKLYRR
jgi:DNA-binding NtrC family response regulator